MLLALTVFIIITQIVVIIKLTYKYKQFKREKNKLVDLISTDENIAILLEASEAPMAKKLLVVSREASVPLWQHNRSAGTPTETTWKLFLEDMELETTDEDKLKCLKVWARKTSFTCFEGVRISKLFSDPRCREKAREFITPERKKTEE